jgi:hypothetical protein
MKENMNNLQDIMTVAYDALNIFPNRPIVMIDTPTLFTYGSIGITAIILAVATIYDEEPESDLANNNSTETPSERNESSYASQLVSPSPAPYPENTESVGGKKNGKSKKDKNKKKRTKRNRN